MRRNIIPLLSATLVLVAAAGWIIWQHSKPEIAKIEKGAIPNYSAPLNISAAISNDQREYLNTQFSTVKAALDATTTDMNAWIALGVVRKEAGDYNGAAEVWEYAANRWPTFAVTFNNLGDLYMNYLKEFPKAETNYKRLIALDPHSIDAYANLYTLYRYSYKTDTGAAAEILAQGLKANPGNAYLLSLESRAKAGN